jgi:integrase
MLWAFSFSKKWVAEKLDKHLVERASEPDKARTILTIEETVRLMAASVDDDIRALNALVLFGGCRREEVEKLDWSSINFKSGHIEISAEISKVNRERFAPIPTNLRSWLRPIAKKSGPIVSRVLMHALRETWKRAGLYPWPQDAHRHSFISYRRRIIGDAQTALDAGTSEKIIKKHYKRPTTKDEAKKYFGIRPVGKRKVAARSKAA